MGEAMRGVGDGESKDRGEEIWGDDLGERKIWERRRLEIEQGETVTRHEARGREREA